MLAFPDGLSRVWPPVMGVTAAVASFVLPMLALEKLPIDTAYVVGPASSA